MKDNNILKPIYARVDVLDYSHGSNTFTKAGSIYFLGDGCDFVKSADDVNVKNKKLVSQIGLETVKQLASKEISGGDVDWDELDEIDIEDLLNAESNEVVKISSSSKTQSNLSGDHFSKLLLYATDKPSDIKEKIGSILKVDPYKQYLWCVDSSRSLDGNDVSLVDYWTHSVRQIEGYPVDSYEQIELTEHALDQFISNSVAIFSFISLDSLVKNKSSLSFLAKSDLESFNLIKSNAFKQFFPMLDSSTFNQYLSDESLIESKFPELVYNFKEVIKMNENRVALNNELQKEKRITINSSDIITIATTDITILLKTSNTVSEEINTLDLFRAIDVQTIPDIAIMDLYYYQNYESHRYRKIQQRDTYRLRDEDRIFTTTFHTKKSLVQSKAIVITLLPTEKYMSLIIVIESTGNMFIKANPSQTIPLSKSAFINHISSVINPIIEIVNSIDEAFMTKNRFPNVSQCKDPCLTYTIVASSSKLNYKFQISYSGLLDLVVSKLIHSGFIKTTSDDTIKSLKSNITSFDILYGVQRSSYNKKSSLMNIRNVNGIAMIDLLNLDVSETALYVDLISRMILKNAKKLELATTDQTKLSTVDPILFRPKASSDTYSRLCQRKFQPVVSNEKDPKATEYYNFTFNRPEYYSCPTKGAPVLGFIQDKHVHGYCIPCCRKKLQPNHEKVRKDCIANDDNDDEKRLSTYKIDYPIHDVPNSKIMNRKVALPAYINQLFGLENLIANGNIMVSHEYIGDGIKANTRSYLQTATIIASVEKEPDSFKSLYGHYRDLTLDIISMIKEPQYQYLIMKHPSVRGRYTTPHELIHAIEDHFLRNHVLEPISNLSAIEWNDFMVYAANCIGLNVLLIEDCRELSKGLHMLNINDIDVNKPVLIMLKRINLEWSLYSHNTRALYLPITLSSFKMIKKRELITPRLSISKSLTKIQSLVFGKSIKSMSKQFTFNQIKTMTSNQSMFKVHSDSNVAVIEIRKSRLVSTYGSSFLSLSKAEKEDSKQSYEDSKLSNIDIVPTATIDDAITFITEYNTFILNETDDATQKVNSYKIYLQAAVKNEKYGSLELGAYLLKVRNAIRYKDTIIGFVLNVVDIDKVVATELMFFKPIKSIGLKLAALKKELATYESKVNVKSIITFPFQKHVLNTEPSKFQLEWMNSPFDLKQSKKVCSHDLTEDYSRGIYSHDIYGILTNALVKEWKGEAPKELIKFISEYMMKTKSLPLPQTKVDELIVMIEKNFKHYDPAVIKVTILELFDQINSNDKKVSDGINRLQDNTLLLGFDLRNCYRLTQKELISKVKSVVNSISTTTKSYPVFSTTQSISEQMSKFYDKNRKVLLHSEMLSDLIDSIIADLQNPFRREYILHANMIERAEVKIKPHVGEVLFIQNL